MRKALDLTTSAGQFLVLLVALFLVLAGITDLNTTPYDPVRLLAGLADLAVAGVAGRMVKRARERSRR